MVNVAVPKQKNYNREQFLSDEDYVNSILDKEGCLLPAFRDLEFTFGHITTSSTACESIRNGGLTKLACTNKGNRAWIVSFQSWC